MNILQLTRQTCQELGISAPAGVVLSSDPTYTQLLAIAQRVGRDLVREWEWQRLVKESLISVSTLATAGTLTAGSPVITGIPSTAGITTDWGVTANGLPVYAQVVSVDSPTQITLNQSATAPGTVPLTIARNQYPLPTDWARQIPQTEWDRGNRWPLNGPKSSQEWQNFKSGIVYAGPRLRFRIVGNEIQINPNPTASSTLSMEYVSSYWVLSAAGVASGTFTADSDGTVFDDQLFISGMKLRWLQQKGLDYGYAMQDYMDTLSLCKAQDKSSPKLSLASSGASVLLSNMNVTDGNFPS